MPPKKCSDVGFSNPTYELGGFSVEHAAGLFPNGLAASFYELPVPSEVASSEFNLQVVTELVGRRSC